jgi:hypothetical protein
MAALRCRGEEDDSETETDASNLKEMARSCQAFFRLAERLLPGKNIGRYIVKTSSDECSKLQPMFSLNIGRRVV